MRAIAAIMKKQAGLRHTNRALMPLITNLS